MDLNTPHDTGYKWLLSSRELFMQLLRSFVKEPWVGEIEPNQIRRTDKSFIAKDFLEKEADLVYEVHLRGRTVILYVLLELQRKVDFSMPYRLLGYMYGIWQNALQLLPQGITLGQKDFRLPAIVPIVLYNGEQPWTAARSFREMVGEGNLFERHLLNFEYILLDVNRYADDELLTLSNTIGAVFLLDKSKRSTEEARLLFSRLFEALQNADDHELAIFLRWMRYVIQPRLSPEQQKFLSEELGNLNKEERKMRFENFEKTLDAFKTEGLLKGIEEGKAEGLVVGKAEGFLKGKEETAVEMLRDKVDIRMISKYTKLSLERIHDLKKRL